MRSVAVFIAIASSALPVLAQDKPALPETTQCPEPVAAIATCYGAKLPTGAYLLAAMPKNWNGSLIVFMHGGPAVVPPTANTSKADLAKYSAVVQLGYAWMASSYRKEGYGVQMAGADTEDARAFFVERIGKPRRTILHGASYGGLVGAKLIEAKTGGSNFDGALFNSGFVIGAAKGHDFRLDLRAVYQYFCKNLPRSDQPQYSLWAGLPAEAKMTLNDLEAIVNECTGIATAQEVRSETQKRNLANILGVMRFPPALLVRHMQAGTFLFREIVERTTNGGNPFSNVGVRYAGSSDDAELNKQVARYGADPAAVAALKADGEPSGAIPVPVVSVHSINDPQVVVEVQSSYRDAVQAAGRGERLVQAYTDERGHTAQSPAEITAAIESLMQWIETGAKPTPQTIAAACERMSATNKGPCSYQPDFVPKAYATRYARGAAGQ